MPRVLHIAGSFAAGDPQAARCVRIANAFGRRLRHSFVSADGRFDALDHLDRAVLAERKAEFPTLSGLPLPGRLQALARAMVDGNLVLTYGRIGVRAALAHTVFSELLRLPPLIHHEDGSDETARGRRGIASTWSRRLGLGKAAGLVVPTELMEGEALVRWQQPLGRVKAIRDGVDLASHVAPLPKELRLARLVKRPGERWIVCAAAAADSALAATLTAALAECDENWHMVVVGGGIEGPPGLEHRVHAAPSTANDALLARLADIVAIPASHEPLPQLAIAAMAAGRPIVGCETGALGLALASQNAAYIAPAGDGAGLAARMTSLAQDTALAESIGAANLDRAMAERSHETMIAAYRRLYASAMQRDTI